ncbi:MAG: non-homologous end-joining DNA ligase [Stellaceae bacterium]
MRRRAADEPPIDIAGVRLTHPSRILYPGQGITKRDLAVYYQKVADWMLPHVAGRPLSLVRCPEGEGGVCFYQKHFAQRLPPGLSGIEIVEKTARGTYGVVEDLAGLLALVQIGVLELHPWGSTVQRLETPDRLIFDLDPDPSLGWTEVVEAALELRRLLQELGLESFAKTTGGKGLHVVVPLRPLIDWERLHAAARAIALLLAERAPQRYTLEAAKKARRQRIFIDYLRNGRGQTAVAPYSPRARSGAPVATPLAWPEVEAAPRPDRFTVKTVPSRLAGLARDPWRDMATLRQSLGAKLLRRLGI